MKSVLLVSLLALTACAGSDPSPGTPPYSSTAVYTCEPPAGAYKIASATLTSAPSADCGSALARWDFVAGPVWPGLTCVTKTRVRKTVIGDKGCHTVDTFSCSEALAGAVVVGDELWMSAELDVSYSGPLEQDGTLQIKMDDGGGKTCDSTYSVTLTKE